MAGNDDSIGLADSGAPIEEKPPVKPKKISTQESEGDLVLLEDSGAPIEKKPKLGSKDDVPPFMKGGSKNDDSDVGLELEDDDEPIRAKPAELNDEEKQAQIAETFLKKNVQNDIISVSLKRPEGGGINTGIYEVSLPESVEQKYVDHLSGNGKYPVKTYTQSWEASPEALANALKADGYNAEKAMKNGRALKQAIRNTTVSIPGHNDGVTSSLAKRMAIDRGGFENAEIEELENGNFRINHIETTAGFDHNIPISPDSFFTKKDLASVIVKSTGDRTIRVPEKVLNPLLEGTNKIQAPNKDIPAEDAIKAKMRSVKGIKLKVIKGEDGVVTHYELHGPKNFSRSKHLPKIAAFTEEAIGRVERINGSGRDKDAWIVSAAAMNALIKGADTKSTDEIQSAISINESTFIAREGLVDNKMTKNDDGSYTITNIKPGTKPDSAFTEKADEVKVFPAGGSVILRIPAADMEEAFSKPAPSKSAARG